MEILIFVAYFFGGAFLTNAIPHLVAGVMGEAFQTPFAKPPGQGLSKSTTNVLWGIFNLVVAYILLVRVGPFDIHSNLHVLCVFAGVLVMGVFSAKNFGKFHGGNKIR